MSVISRFGGKGDGNYDIEHSLQGYVMGQVNLFLWRWDMGSKCD